MNAVTNNKQKSRYELEESGELAFADYTLCDGVLTLAHVEAAPALRGTGAASRLMEGVLKDARERDLKVRPVCTYAVAFLRKHHEFGDLVVE